MNIHAFVLNLGFLNLELLISNLMSLTHTGIRHHACFYIK